MQRPNVPSRNTRPMTPRGQYYYAVTYANPTDPYQYKDYNSQVLIPPQQPVAGQALPYGQIQYRWDYPYHNKPVYGHPIAPQPMAHPVPQKKVLDIIDPNTGEKVDLTKVGTTSKNSDPAKEQIRAQFASKVAAVAAPKKPEVEEKCEVVEDVNKYENGIPSVNKEEEEEELDIEQQMDKGSTIETVKETNIIVEPEPTNINLVIENYSEKEALPETNVTDFENPEQQSMEDDQNHKEVLVNDKNKQGENIIETNKEVEPSLEEAKGDNSDSEWKETKRSKKKKKATKPEQQQNLSKGNISQNQQQPPHRQQRQVTNGTAPNIQGNVLAKDELQQSNQQHQEVAPKEAQTRVVPPPTKNVPVWPSVKSNLVPSSQPQAPRLPQAAQPQQIINKPQQQSRQPLQSTKQQPAAKQLQCVPSTNPKLQPINKQVPVVASSRNVDEQLPKAGGKRKSKEKNRNKKNLECQKPKSPEPSKAEESVTKDVRKEQVAPNVEVPEEVPMAQEAMVEESEVLELVGHIDVPLKQTEEEPVTPEVEEIKFEDKVETPIDIKEAHLESTSESVLLLNEDVVTTEEDVDKLNVILGTAATNPEEIKVLETEPISELVQEKVDSGLLNEKTEDTQQAKEEYELEEGEIVDDDDDDSGEDAEKRCLKFKYSENQWSPLNPEGPKKYDRDFLLQIQQAVKLNRPSLPDLDIVLKEPHMRHVSGSTPNIGAPADFGSYVRQNSNSYGNSRGQNRGQYRGYENRKVIEHKLSDNVVLHKSEDAWHRGVQRDEINKVMSSMKSILNKLTPQNFESLMDQVKQITIDCEEKLAGCISLIFEQCIRQPIYSGLYARMAKCFSLLAVPSEEDPSKTITFRKLLLTKCQQEFEQDKENEREILALSDMIEASEKDDEKKVLEERKEEAMMNAKRRSLGNIRFIGELYKLSMLTENIMHECLGKLLSRYEDEDNLECLCKLLTTIGKDIDNPKSKLQPRVDAYFREMRRLIDENKTSTRIKFMMMDVADLRKRGWMLKHNEGPKTIEQIHKDAEKEKMEVQKRMEDAPLNRGSRRQTSRHSNVPLANSVNEDGWTNVSRPPKSQGFDASKIKLTRMEDNIQLGPGRNSWNKGSTGGVAKEQQSFMPSNRYSLLSNSTEEPTRHHSNSSGECERYTARHSGFSSFKTDRLSSNERLDDSSQASAITGAITGTLKKGANLEIPKEEMETKVKSRIEEYLINKDIKEAIETVKELKTESCLKNAIRFFYCSIEQNIEKSSKIREEVGVLHLHLLKNRAAPIAAYATALKKMVKFADDLAVDVPQVWKYIGEIVSPVFLEGSNFRLNILVPDSSRTEDSDDEFDSEENDNIARLFAEVLNAVSHKMGHHQASELWESSNLKWEDFIKCQPVSDFLKSSKVDYTVQSSDMNRRRHRLISVNENKNELIVLFSKSETTVEDIHDWIFENWGLSGQDMNNPSHLKSVSDCCTALCMSCLHKRHDSSLNEYDLDEERMKKFLCVIKTLTFDKQDRQLEVLFGLQELFHRLSYPKDLLHRLFELLFDAEVLNETAFHQWKEDATRTVGKGVAISSVSRFYNWIVEEEKDQCEDN